MSEPEDSEALDRLLDRIAERETRDHFSRLFQSADGELIEHFYEQVDESAYSFDDWIGALLSFDDWLSASGVAARPLEAMIGYLHCCTLTRAETLAAPGLDRLLQENLDRYGFDAASSASSEPG